MAHIKVISFQWLAVVVFSVGSLSSLVSGCTEPEPPSGSETPAPTFDPDRTPTPRPDGTPSPTATPTPGTGSTPTVTPPSSTPTPASITPTPPDITPTPASITPTPASITPTPPDITPTPPGITPTPEPPSNDLDGDHVTVGQGDCNDHNASIYPGADEEPYDDIDQDCDGRDLTDVDEDGADGGPTGEDCDDNDPTRFPDNAEIPYDGIDQDCTNSDLTDVDQDGYKASQVGGNDCNDTVAQVHPGATEIPYDGIDQDCSGKDLIDVDGDGQASTQAGGRDCNDTNASINPSATEVCDGIDNNCDGVTDSDAVNRSTGHPDGDGDGYGNPGGTVTVCTLPSGYVTDGTDCNDSAAGVHPNAIEVCNQIDDDCDALIDEDTQTTYYLDSDKDGYGVSTQSITGCTRPNGYSVIAGDCNDQNAAINPAVQEICDATNVDEDCDGLSDDQDSSVLTSSQTTYYPDLDADGYGDPAQSLKRCDAPSGYVLNGGDCAPTNATVHPGAIETTGDSIDQDCDGKELCYKDADDDGYRPDSTSTVLSLDGDCLDSGEALASDPTGDCSDGTASIYPNATETCNGVDDNCNGSTDEGLKTLYYLDSDADGYGTTSYTILACTRPSGYATVGGDCNDASNTINPGATETCNGLDDNCNGSTDEGLKTTYYQDSDGDGYGLTVSTLLACSKPVGYATVGGDCNDASNTIYPGATELCNEKDDNCNGSIDEGLKSTYYQDSDGDGYGLTVSTVQACSKPSGFASLSGDCNDGNPAIHPYATETCNGLDDNCDNTIDENAKITYYQDADLDGYGVSSSTQQACTRPTGYATLGGDCNDTNAAVSPAAVEQPGDSFDQNCDGKETCYKDYDDDGYRPDTTSTTVSYDIDCYGAGEATGSDPVGDCNDSVDAIHPGATETCNTFDDDCDGSIDEGVTTNFYRDADGDGYGTSTVQTQACARPSGYSAFSGDCNDTNASISPIATELPGDSIDQDCNGQEMCYKDADNDGYRPDSSSTAFSVDTDCSDVNEAVSSDPVGDCNDTNASINPGATEVVADGIDQTCDGKELCYVDADNDGYRPNGVSFTTSQDLDCLDSGEGTPSDPSGDCDDTNSAVHPGTIDAPGDIIDSDCDGYATDVLQFAGGGFHTLVLDEDGHVWAWGDNSYGQLGNGTTLDSNVPVLVSGINNAVYIAAGMGHSLAVLADGTVKAWGLNNYGQLGTGTTTNALSPVSVSGLTGITQVAAGANHSLALNSSKTVVAWGYNAYGQLGDYSLTTRTTPVSVPGLANVINIAAGDFHSMAIVSGGTVRTWGNNNYGQLGNGSTAYSTNAVQVTGLGGVVAIGGGATFSVALLSDGTAKAWGDNSYYQLGDNSNSYYRTSPGTVSGVTGAIALAVGSNHAAVLLNDKSVQVWGDAASGQYGNGNLMTYGTPSYAISLGDVLKLGSGGNHLMALMTDHSVETWGNNGDGQLGDGDVSRRSSPVAVSSLNNVLAVSSTLVHMLALKSDGTVVSWGFNSEGALGDGTYQSRNSPVAVSGLSGVKAVAAGYSHNLALMNDGTVKAWGTNYCGELGNGTLTASRTPVTVSGLTGVQAVAAGGYFSLALMADGTVKAWGYNARYQLGDGSTTDRLTPVTVTGVTGITAISAGYYHSLALTSTKSIRSWGYNSLGVLGNGTTTGSTTATTVSNISTAVAVAAGPYHSLAVLADGTVRSWGGNLYGELGNGTTTAITLPSTVVAVSNAAYVSAGLYASYVLLKDGSVRAFGYNNWGQLGDGTQTNQIFAVSVPGLTLKVPTVVQGEDRLTLTGGYSTFVGVKADGTAVAVGSNAQGQLGIGRDTWSSRPVLWP